MPLPTLKGVLVTVRTSKQGVAMVKGKAGPEYQEETSTLRVSAGDLDRLGLEPGQEAKLSSPFGQALVRCQAAQVPPGLFFLPLGPTANQLIGADTQGTGVPSFKALEVELETAQPA